MQRFIPSPEAIELIHNGQIALSEVEAQGIRIDKDYLDSALDSTAVQIKKLKDALLADPDYKKHWRRRFGDKSNVASPAQIAAVVFQDLGHKSKIKTTSGARDSASEKALEGIDIPLVKNYLEMQHLIKGRDTFLEGIRRETVQHDDGDYWVHPVYNLNTAVSFRSSASDFNIQNQPTRNPMLAEMVRRAMVPRRGYQFIEMDYCLHPDTQVKTIYGDKRIGDINAGDKVFSLHDGKIWWSEVTHSGFVGELPSYRVTFDNGESIVASAQHKWPVRVKPPNPKGAKIAWASGGRVIVEKTTVELAVGDRMVPCRTVCNQKNGYEHLYSKSAFDYTKTHLLVANAVHGPCPVGHAVHHKDENKANNLPDNLEYRDKKSHLSEHSLKNWDRMTGKQKKQKVKQLRDSQWKRRSMVGAANPNYGNRRKIKGNCLYCDREFWAAPSTNRKYCKVACYHAAKRDGLNHKVVSVEFVGNQPSHGITVEPDHNFVLSCGVVTCNSQQEVRVSACYNKDPNLINYICDPTTDMHRDVGEQIFMVKRGELSKPARHVAKNQFTFPTFYGSYYAQMTPAIWDSMALMDLKVGDKPMRQHLAEHGITERGECDPEERPEPGTFEYHLKEIEEDFWGNRFAVYAEWKKDWLAAYRRDGGCQFLTGFIMVGPHAKNDVTNYCVQGSAFHCLLWAITKIVNCLRRYKMRSRVVAQIHDCVIGDVHPDERDDYIEIVRRYMVEEIKKWAPWLIVPLSAEVEVCPVDASWYEKKAWVEKNGKWVAPEGKK